MQHGTKNPDAKEDREKRQKYAELVMELDRDKIINFIENNRSLYEEYTTPVTCLTTMKVYKNIHECIDELNVTGMDILKACDDYKHVTCGILDGRKLHWIRTSDLIRMSDEEKELLMMNYCE